MEGAALALRAPDGATVVLERFPLLLGRLAPGGALPDIDVSHLDPNRTVDNRHCQLEDDDQGVVVHDLGGAGGTWVASRRLPPGGRAVLEQGAALRIGTVVLTLVRAPSRRPQPPPGALAPAPAPDSWRDAVQGAGVPPPPSAGSSEDHPRPRPPSMAPSGGLDLSGAPPVVRELLDSGADAVRLLAGEGPWVRTLGSWRSEGDPLSALALEEAIAVARRVLALPEEADSGFGEAGDLAIDFLEPPLVDRHYLGVRVTRREPAEIPWEHLAAIGDQVLAGQTVLIVDAVPEPVLAALGNQLDRSASRPAALDFGPDQWWVPSGWPRLDRDQHRRALSAGASPLFVNRPPWEVAAELVAALPRLEGGTVVAISAAAPASALEHLAAALPGLNFVPGPEQRGQVARLFPWAVKRSQPGWQLSRVGLGADGDWLLTPVAET